MPLFKFSNPFHKKSSNTKPTDHDDFIFHINPQREKPAYDVYPFVMDLGSSSIKASMENNEYIPRCDVLNGVMKQDVPRYKFDNMKGMLIEDVMERAMKEGEVVDWSLMDSVLGDTFYKECRESPEEHPMAVAISSYFSMKDRYKLAEILYETYCCPTLMYINQGRASLRRYGSTGIDISIGEGVACVVPVVNGIIIKENIKKLNVNGSDLTKYIDQLIAKKGVATGTALDPRYCESVKNIDTIKAQCFLLDEYNEESDVQEQSFEFDDCTISLGKELYQAPEALFQPHLIGKDCPGLAEVVHSCISACDVDIRNELYENILFSGASSLFKNLAPRLKKELTVLAPNHYKIQVRAPPESKYSVWMGTCAEAKSIDNSDKWVTREMYEEQGEGISSKFSTSIC